MENMKPTVENIISVYTNASSDAFREGMDWYDNARLFCASLSSDRELACGVTAAISANTSWTANMTLARKAFSQGNGDGMGFDDKVDKINRMFAGEHPLDVLGGKKIRAFYATLMDEIDPVPVIDRHAYDVTIQTRLGSKPRPLYRKGVYEVIADLYREAADAMFCLPQEIQAVTWVSWREVNGIRI